MSRPLAKWDRRIERAQELAAKHPFAAEALRFYARIAGFQKSLYAALGSAGGSLRGGLDLSILLPHFAPYLALIADIAPSPLAQSAAGLRNEVLEDFWQGGERLTPAEALIA